MTRKIRIVGSGITKRREILPEVEIDLSHASPVEIDAVLTQMSDPTSETWERFSRRFVAKARSLPESERRKLRRFESESWYASQVTRLDEKVRQHIVDGEAEAAAIAAARCGALVKEIELKLAWEPDALRGRKTKDDATVGGRIRQAQRRSAIAIRRAKFFEVYQENIAVGRNERLARKVACEAIGCSDRTARRFLASRK